MRIHYIQHASFEEIGVIEDWARLRGHTLSGTHTYRGEKLPSSSSFDFLIIMGGPQSPREIDRSPYLADEITLIKSTLLENKYVVGFCLGAQLIAEALGAKTDRSPEKEVGVFPITLTETGRRHDLFHDFPNNFDVIHWHNDMPGLPEGAELLAFSKGCPRQAFSYGDRFFGFQFHMEITPEIAQALIDHCPEDLKPGKYIQSEEEFLSQDFRSINQNMLIILDRIFLKNQKLAS